MTKSERGYIFPPKFSPREGIDHALGGRLARQFLKARTPGEAAEFLRSHEKEIARKNGGYSIHDEGMIDPDEGANLLGAWLTIHRSPYEAFGAHFAPNDQNSMAGESGVWVRVGSRILSPVNQGADPDLERVEWTMNVDANGKELGTNHAEKFGE